jgi:hypothetical protein
VLGHEEIALRAYPAVMDSVTDSRYRTSRLSRLRACLV